MIVECVVNVSEGRDVDVLAALADAAGPTLRDLHRDPDHHRSVLTLAGGAADVATAHARWPPPRWHDSTCAATTAPIRASACSTSCPSSPTRPGRPAPDDLAGAAALRDEFARWLADELGVPSFLYGPCPAAGPAPSPTIRRHAFRRRRGSGAARARRRPAARRPARRGHRGGGPPRARGLQRVGVLGRGGQTGRPARAPA